MKQKTLFDEENRLELLSQLGDPLEILNRVIKWEKFRSVLNQGCRKEDTGKGGRPPYDVVMMFKILVLLRLYNLSDDQTEYQINDRMSFMRFLGINLCDKVPDAKTIWKFKNDLAETETVDKLFCMFDEHLEKEGLISRKGTIVDATFVDAPRQRNSRDENKKIKNGEIPEEWEKPENKSKLAQKDIDADWTKKNGERHFGYKDHVKCDADSKLITNYSVTSASVHDSQRCLVFIGQEDEVLYADSAYSGKPIALALPESYENQMIAKLKEERSAYLQIVRDNIDYDFLVEQNKYKISETDELVSLMVDTICSTKPFIRVNGENIPHEVVKSTFLKLNSSHIEYVLEAMDKNSSDVRNIRSYLITALYNSRFTLNSYWGARVNHDMG